MTARGRGRSIGDSDVDGVGVEDGDEKGGKGDVY